MVSLCFRGSRGWNMSSWITLHWTSLSLFRTRQQNRLRPAVQTICTVYCIKPSRQTGGTVLINNSAKSLFKPDKSSSKYSKLSFLNNLEDSLRSSRKLAAGPYCEPGDAVCRLFKIIFNITPHLCLSLTSCLNRSLFPTLKLTSPACRLLLDLTVLFTQY